MKKRTLICIHVMPSELEMFERQIQLFKKAFLYLDERDDVTLKVTLNLNPGLTDWENSELKNGHFIMYIKNVQSKWSNAMYILMQLENGV